MEVTLERPLVELYLLVRDPAYTSLKPKSKEPVGSAWQNNPKSPELVLHEHRKLGNNIGLINGSLSGVVDVDLDCEEAVALAPVFLPEALAEFQHSGNARGHMLFRTPNAGKTQQFKCPDTGSTLVELRSTGSQTMLPPSVHPSGHALRFTEIRDTADAIDFEELTACVRQIAACSLVAQNWQAGSRHQLALGLSGLMLKAGIGKEVAETIIAVICKVTADTEVFDRLSAVRTTYKKLSSEVSGYGLLSDVLGDRVLNRLSEWLGIKPDLPSLHQPKKNLSLLSDMNNEDELTEESMAKAFSAWATNRATYVHQYNKWYLWNGVIWQPDPANSVRMLMAEVVSDIRNHASQIYNRRYEEALRRFESLSKIKNSIELSQPRLVSSSSEFNKDPMLLAVRNTWIDLKTGFSVQPTADTLVSLCADVAYDPNADCPVFKTFLGEVFQQQEVLISFIQRVFGYCLTASVDEQCFFIMNGDGANGKSTLLNLFSKLLGSYAKTAAEHTLLANQRVGVGDDLEYLVGSRLITVPETDAKHSLAEAKLKRMTGGDEIAGRALYSSYENFKITGKIVVPTNILPQVSGRDHGIFRRFQIIPFTRTFEPHEQDRSLPQKLNAESSGILNWAIQGCLNWQEEGLNPPLIVTEQLEHYRKDLDTVSKFVEAHLIRKPENKLRSQELYQAYRRWCSDMGYSIVNDKHFKLSMLNIEGVGHGKDRSGKFYRGLSFFPANSNEGVGF